MNVLVTGGGGQVARALAQRGFVRRRQGLDDDAAIPIPRDGLDICDPAAIRRHVAEVGAAAVINCAAYTAVDKAETEREAAFAVNATGAGILASVCAELRVPLVHVSTDYVFDGTARRPYREDDPIAPLGVYGESKAAGEAAVRAANPAAIVVRTSWVFSGTHPSFVRTMVRLARARPVLRVVDDQIGCPTFAGDLADVLFQLAERAVAGADLDGTYHACNAGPVSWCGFARAIVDEARRHGEIACTEVVAITTAEYPTPARRPAYSVLDTTRLHNLGISLPAWSVGLEKIVPWLLAEVYP